MKITYAISLKDYSALLPGFTLRAGHNAGFKGVAAVCGLVALLGVFGFLQGAGILFGVFLIGLGLVVAALSYFLDKRSVQKAKGKYLKNVAAGYQRIHCPDQRTLEADENGFTVNCRCGTVTRPWSALVQVSENPQLFILGTNLEGQVVPKSAFSSEGAVTEFRAYIHEKFNKDRSFTSRPIEFSLTKRDSRDAYLVRLLRAGEWRGMLRKLAVFGFSAYAAFVIWAYISPGRNVAPLCALLGGAWGILVLRIARPRQKPYRGPLRIYSGEEGLYLEDPGTLARNSWKQFIGYLEAERIFLLYYNPRLYRIIPKRALAGQEVAFRELLKRKLPPYNYRNPIPVASSGASARPGQPS